jgi:glycosyltransferase involved in cell wall biosynthesis
MRIWLLTIGEPLPTDSDDVRLLRTGQLAILLAGRGHEVVWWSSTFDHTRKRQRHPADTQVALSPRLTLRLLRAPSYRSNLSLRRQINHLQIARRFAKAATEEPRPDLVLCSMPPVELAHAAVRFARGNRVPIVLDVRDLWPDAIVAAAPRPLRPVARILLRPQFRAVHTALRDAHAVVAVSPSYLRWALELAGRTATPQDHVFPLAYPETDGAAPHFPEAEAAMRRQGVDPSRRIVWFLGSFGHWYDLDTVVRAARSLARDERHELQFVLSGAGHADARLRRAARGLPNVVFTGWIDRSEIAFLMSVAWVGLAAYAPHAPQSYPNKLFEYMSAGLPVVSSLRGDAEKLLVRHRCGLSYRPGDADHLAHQLLVLLTAADLHREMSTNARAAFSREYSASMVYAQMADHLAAVAQPAPETGASP